VPGGSLQRMLRVHRDTGVPVELAVRALTQVASALGAAHRQRPPVLHRDLTPANVLVGYDDHGLRVRLGDFGLAKNADPVTQMASAQGTLAYLAPEVLRGDGYTVAGDVWSWGALAYLMLTNELPYEDRRGVGHGSTARFRQQLLPPSGYNDDVSPELDRIVLAALELSPSNRPADCQALYEQLRGQPRPRGRSREYPAAGESAERLAAEALELARETARLPDAADLLEEAVSRDARVRDRYSYRLTLWRRGVMM